MPTLRSTTGRITTRWVIGLMLSMLPFFAATESSNSGIGAIRNLDYAIIICKDIEVMRSFYREVMQFEIFRETPGQWVEFKVGSSLLTLRPRNRPYDGSAALADSASLQLAFRVPPNDIDIAFEALKAEGVQIIEPPKDQTWGHRTLFFFDPESNVIELYADI